MLKAWDVGDEVGDEIGDEDADDDRESIVVTVFGLFRPDVADLKFAQGFVGV